MFIMKIDEIRALLEKYQEGLCTAEECRLIEEWYDSLRLESEGLKEEAIDSSLEKIRGNLQALTGGAAGSSPEIDAASADYPATATGPAVTPVIRPHRWGRPAWMAAAILTAVLAGSAWLLFHQPPSAHHFLALNDNEDTTVITNRGETKQLVLPDGSTIELNAASEFRYPKKFSRTARTVALLQGEAFFQVADDPTRPFSVTTGKWRTTVLGTSFDIRAYGQHNSFDHDDHDARDAGGSAGLSPIQIALLTGKIKVSEDQGATGTTPLPGAGTQSVLLTPRQMVKIDPTTGKMQTDKFIEDYEVAAWKEGAMHFKDASFADIAFGIRNKYNMVLINRSNKQRWSYTGLFRNESLREVVETICLTEDLGYRFTDEGILIVNKN